MLKKLVTLIAFLALIGMVNAEITIVKETGKATYFDNDLVELGSIQPGETLEITISSKTGHTGLEWDQLVFEGNIPEGWNAIDSETGKKTLTAKLELPLNASVNAYHIKIKALNKNNEINPETLTLQILVRKDLIETAISQNELSTIVNKPTAFTLSIVNNSIASHTIKVESNLSPLWFETKEITVKPEEVKGVDLVVIPRIYGFKDFYFTVSSVTRNELLDIIPVHLNINPTLQNKYETAFYGFPFFTPNLLTQYLINAFISMPFN